MIRRLAALGAAAALLGAAAAPAGARDYVGLVNPWIEADRGRFFFFQSAATPFGFAKLRPDTSTGSTQGSGYPSTLNEVKGFSHVHEWRLSGIQVMPTSGPPVVKTRGDSEWQSPVDHGDEVAEPGYHRVHLDRYGIDAELTATDRVGLHRYTYDKAGPGEIVVNLGGVLGQATMKDAHVERVGRRQLVGWVRQSSTGFASHDTKLYFDLRVDRPFTALDGWVGDKLVDDVDALGGEQMGVSLRYDRLSSLQMKVGLSLTGIDGASRNLEAEAPGWDFDRARRAAQARWNALLGRIDVHGTPAQEEKFYTDLFHVLCGRGVVSDADGAYLDDTWNAGVVRHGGPMFNYDALWLTQWNVNTVLGLAYPEIYADFVASQLRMYRDGGLLPRGPVAGNYSMVMTSSPVTSFITGAINKGIEVDEELAYEAMMDAHAVGGLFDKQAFEYDAWSSLAGAHDYLTRGYVPYDLATGPLAGGAGMTLEYANQDYALAQLARRLGKRGINVAQFAVASASSGVAERAIDGRPARSGDVRWVGDGGVRLDWDTPQHVRRIVLTDPGTLRFSDGTSMAASGEVKVDKTVSWIRFEGDSLGEIEVYDDRDVAAYLEERSRNWRNLFDPSTGFIRPKGADGSWLEPFDPLVGRGLRRGQRVAVHLVHLARRDGAGQPAGRRGGLRREARLRVRVGGRVRLPGRLRRRLRQLRQPGRAADGPPLQLRRLPVAVAALGAAGQGARLQRDHDHRRLRPPRRGPGPDGRVECADGDRALRGHRRGAAAAGLRHHVTDLPFGPSPGLPDRHAWRRRVHPAGAAERPCT